VCADSADLQVATRGVVADYYAAIDDGDLATALRPFAADAVYRRPGYPPLVGRDAIRSYYEDQRVIGSGRHLLESVLADGQEVAVRGSFVGQSRDGRPLSVRFADFWRLDDGQVVERNTYFDAAAV
jgi:ketosteroid isomerase-like protein